MEFSIGLTCKDLSYAAQMNVQMDRLADKVQDGPDTTPTVPEYKTDFQIRINGEILYSNVADSL